MDYNGKWEYYNTIQYSINQHETSVLLSNPVSVYVTETFLLSKIIFSVPEKSGKFYHK